MVIFAAVGLVTGGTAGPECSPVKDILGTLKLGLSAMTLGADSYRIRTYKTGPVSCMRVMAAKAITLSPPRAALSRSGSFFRLPRDKKGTAHLKQVW